MRLPVCWLALGGLALGPVAALGADRPKVLAEPPEGSYVQIPAKEPGLAFAAFCSAFLDPADEEDEYPLVLQLSRKGVPVWSRIATVEHDWPFLNIELKVAWFAGGQRCLVSYRPGRNAATAFMVDLSGPVARYLLLDMDKTVDAALASKGDGGQERPAKEAVESLEWLKDGSSRIVLQAVGRHPHRVTLILDGQTGGIAHWTIE